MYCVIMAGGRGTRFWPSSRRQRPKQMLDIIGSKPMLQVTVDRLKKIKCVEDIFIIACPELTQVIREEIEGIHPDNVLTEPSGKNTAPCIGLAALHLQKLKPDAVMGVFPADHMIVGHRKFEKALHTAKHLARKNPFLVTIGIEPTYPATGYGYIQFDPNSAEDYLNAFKVKTFAEKPHLELAKRFLKSKDFLWNGGIFVWNVETFFDQIHLHMPDLADQLKRIGKRLAKGQAIDTIWNQVNPESIDYGLMEKSDRIYVVQAEFRWSDLGSWDAVYDISPKSKGNNVVRGSGLVLDGENNFIQSNGRFTAILGANNLVVVNTEDATLVVPRDQVENVKKLVEYLEKHNRKDLL